MCSFIFLMFLTEHKNKDFLFYFVFLLNSHIQVERHLTEIDGKIDTLKELHRKRLMVTFDSDEQAQVFAFDLSFCC